MTSLGKQRSTRHRALALVCALMAIVVAGCSSNGSSSASSTTEAEIRGTAAPPRTRSTTVTRGSPGANPTTGQGTPSSSDSTTSAPSDPNRRLTAKVKLNQLGSVTSPVAMTSRPGSPILYVAEQAGRIRTLRVNADGTTGTVDSAPLLDISSEVDGRGERGLLGLAFSADGKTLFTYHSDKDGTNHVVSHTMNGDQIDTDSRLEILTLVHQRPNHNGGQLATGPDGMLYIGVGDGGGGGDPDRNGQNKSTLYGKILRIDPAKPANGKNYGIPPGNPFADGSGAPEVWVYGARNPWRFSFDRQTGDLWVGDVGQNEIEEIDFLPNIPGEGAGRGANLGWRNMEGSRPYEGGSPPANAVAPVFEYNHDNNECSVISGFVYRGKAVPDLNGVLAYADYCTGPIRGLLTDDGNVVDEASLGARTPQLTSFGQDNDGEQYVLSQTGGVYRMAAG